MDVGRGKAFVNGKTGAEEACGKSIDFRNEDSLFVQSGACAPGGGEQLVIEGIVDHPGEQGSPLSQSDGNGKARIAVCEIGRPVEWVHMPAKFGTAFVAGSLFRGDRMLRKIFCESRDNGFFGALVRLRDQVYVTLVTNLRRPVELLAQDFARFLGDIDGCVKKVFAHGE